MGRKKKQNTEGKNLLEKSNLIDSLEDVERSQEPIFARRKRNDTGMGIRNDKNWDFSIIVAAVMAK